MELEDDKLNGYMKICTKMGKKNISTMKTEIERKK